MNSSYISSSIFNEKSNSLIIEDSVRLKNIKMSHVFKNLSTKDLSSNLNNLLVSRNNLRLINSNLPTLEDK